MRKCSCVIRKHDSCKNFFVPVREIFSGWNIFSFTSWKFLNKKRLKAIEFPEHLLYNVINWKIVREFAKVHIAKTERGIVFVKTYL